MRKAFIETMLELAEADERVLLLTGDLGFMVMEPFMERYPKRFINVGVAEQNMIGLATGLAEAGFIPYAYSIATFACLRPFEFIRNGPVLHKLPVRIVGMGMGFEYGHAGPTHHAVEDVAVMRTLPGLTVVIPADSAQAGNAVRDTASLMKPIYFSLGKDDRLSVDGLSGRFGLGKLQVIRSGIEIAIVAMGSIAVEAVAAAETLSRRGIEASVAIVSTFNPDPYHDLTAFLKNFRNVIVLEAQVLSGGLSALVSSVIASEGLVCKLEALAVRFSPDGTSGPQSERWIKNGLDRESIVRAALNVRETAQL